MYEIGQKVYTKVEAETLYVGMGIIVAGPDLKGRYCVMSVNGKLELYYKEEIGDHIPF